MEAVRRTKIALALAAFGVTILLAWSAVAQDGSDEFLERFQQIRAQLDRLQDGAEVEEIAELLSAYPKEEVLAQIEARVTEKGIGALLDLRTQLQSEGEGESPEDEDPPDVAPYTEGDAASVQRYFNAQAVRAEKLLKEGRIVEARNTVNACMIFVTEAKLRARLQRLSVAISKEFARKEGVVGRVAIDDGPFFVGDTLNFRFVLTNTGEEPVSLHFPEGKEGAGELALVILEMDVTDLDPLGQSLTARDTPQSALLKFDTPLRLAPGEHVETTYSIDTSLMDPEFRNLRVYTLKGTLTPIRTHVGEVQHDRFKIGFGPVAVRVLPAGGRKYVEKPLEQMANLLASEEATVQDIFLCGNLLSRDDSDAALELMMPALKAAEGPGAQMLIVLIRRLADEDHGLSKDAWLRWWNDTQAGPTVIPDD